MAGSDFGGPASDETRIAEISAARLGGGRAPQDVEVTGVSIYGRYGLTVYKIGTAQGEALFLKERTGWRVLGSDAFDPGGRGLYHFGVQPDLARALIAGLHPPPGAPGS